MSSSRAKGLNLYDILAVRTTNKAIRKYRNTICVWFKSSFLVFPLDSTFQLLNLHTIQRLGQFMSSYSRQRSASHSHSHIAANRRTVLYLCLLAMGDKLTNCRSVAREGQWLNECHPQTSLGDTIQQHDIWRHVLHGAQLWRNNGMLTSWELFLLRRSKSCLCGSSLCFPFAGTQNCYIGVTVFGGGYPSVSVRTQKKMEVCNNGYLKCNGKAFFHRKRT